MDKDLKNNLAFIEKYCDGVVPQENNNIELDNQIDSLYIAVGKLIESGYLLPEVEILFQRIDKKVIEEETEKFPCKLLVRAKTREDTYKFTIRGSESLEK